MKFEDVMVGDWVRIKNFRYLQLELDQFYAQGCHLFKGDIIDYFETFEPIPLTQEIIDNNRTIFERPHGSILGIQLNPDNRDDHSLYFYAMLGDEEHMRIRVKYVHELQHALRVAGFKDLADNFKIEKRYGSRRRDD